MDQLLFILGLPRSGTTLLQRILDTAPEIATVPEPWIMLPFLSFRESRHYKAIYGSSQAVLGINEFLGNDEGFEQGMFQYVRNYLDKRYPDHRYFCEKTPRNLLYADRLRKQFPKDRFIVLNRNPLNVAASIFRTFESGVLNPYKFQVDLDRGLRQLIALNRNPDGALVLRYEDLVCDPVATLSRCDEFLRLESPLDPQGTLPRMEGKMGDPTGQFSMSRIRKQKELAYLTFVDSAYRKRWFLRFMERLGPEGFAALGYDFKEHYRALKSHRVSKPIALRDLGYLVGRKTFEFISFRVLPRRPAERPDYVLY